MNPTLHRQHHAAEDVQGALPRGPKRFRAALQARLREDLQTRLQGLDLATLAVWAAIPEGSFPAAEALFGGGAADFLDRALQAGWIEIGADLTRLDLEATLQRAQETISPPPLTLLQAIGLIPENPARSGAPSIEPLTTDPLAIDPLAPGTTLRALGCRLICSRPIPEKSHVAVTFSWHVVSPVSELASTPSTNNETAPPPPNPTAQTAQPARQSTTLLGAILDCVPAEEGEWTVAIGFGPSERPAPGAWRRLWYSEFTMPRAKRAELLEYLRGQTRVSLRDECASAARKLAEAFPEGRGLPPRLADWVMVANELNSTEEAAAVRLRSEIEARLRSGRTGEALQFLQTAQWLADALGGAVSTGSRLLQRLLEQEYRRAMDERYLGGFLERREQIAACEELLAPTQRSWALHLLGIGGMGKTMLIRYLAARFAPQRGLLVSRVDFDYLTPDYPVRRPGQLLLALAEGLLAYGTDQRVEHVHKEFQARTLRLHGQLEAQPSPGNPLENLQHPAFEELLIAFADLIRVLPVKPVLFILDTCEELAKLQPDGAFLPGVEATFKILEDLQTNLARDHAEFPVRVIFSGRRLLCQSGDGWRAEGPVSGAPRPYLRLHEIRGFDQAEARRFLQTCKRPDPTAQREPMGKGLVCAILQRSKDRPRQHRPDQPREQHRVLFDPPEPTRDTVRYNPFKLNLYADWWLADQTVDAKRLTNDPSDPYVEHRIVRRLQQHVRDILPQLILLRRWEPTLLERLFGRGPDGTANLSRELAQLEWTDFKPYQPYCPNCHGVNDHHLPGLEAYVNAPARTQPTAVAREAVGRALAELIRVTPLREILPEYLDGALAMLPLGLGAELWDEIERRIPSEADWKWAQDITGLLLGERGRVPAALRSAVSATQLEALRHTQPDFDAFDRWVEVEELAPKHPQAETAASLRRRALALQVAARTKPGSAPDPELLARFWNMVSAWLSREGMSDHGQSDFHTAAEDGALASAFEALIESVEFTESSDAIELSTLREWQKIRRGRAPGAFVKMLVGQVMRRNQRVSPLGAETYNQGGDAFLAQAARDVGAIPDEELAQPYPFWPDLSHLRSRARLTWLSDAGDQRAINTTPEDLVRWQSEATTQLPDEDADRLLSVIVAHRSETRLIPKSELDSLAAELAKHPAGAPKRQIHRRLPSLAVTLAGAYASAGFPATALRLLDPLLRQSAEDRHAQEMRGRIIRRYRLTERSQNAEAAARLKDIEALAAWYSEISLCDAPTHRSLADPKELPDHLVHLLGIWWRAYAFEIPGKLDPTLELVSKRLRAQANQDDPARRSTIAWNHLALLEADELKPSGVTYKHFSTAALFSSSNSLLEGAALRLDTLQIGRPGEAPISSRRLAEVALEEGSLWALRFPELAVERLLKPALKRFLESQDPVGAFQAAVAGLIAWIRAGKLDAARKWLAEQVKPSYPRLEFFHAWPPWPEGEAIDNLWDSPTFSAWQRDPDWAEWLKRLFTAVKFLQDPSLQKVETWQSWSAKHLGSALPAELNMLRPDLAGRSWRKFLVNGLYGVLGFTIAAGGWYGMFRLFSNGWERWIASGSSLWIRIPAFLATATAIILAIGWLAPRLKRFPGLNALVSTFFGMIVLRLSLRPEGKSEPLVVKARMDARYSFLGRLGTQLFGSFLARSLGSYPFQLLGEGVSWNPINPTAGLSLGGRPGVIGERLAQSNQALSRILRWFTPENRPLEIDVEAAQQSFPWEIALFAETYSSPADAPLNQYCVYRVGAPAQARRRLPGQNFKREINVFGPRHWWELIKQSWTRGRHEAGAPFRDPEPIVEHNQHLPKVEFSDLFLVQHLIGRPHRLSDSVSLAVDDSVLTIDQLPTLASLVVLQGEPVVSESGRFPDWTETERAGVQQLRSLASEIFLRGAWAVLMIPPLPSDVAAKAVESVGLNLGFRRRPAVGQLRRVLGQVQRVIDRAGADRETPRSLAQREAALSVALFARAD